MSDGQFSSKPIWSGKRTDITATAASGADTYSANDAKDFAQSASVRREVNALREEPHLDVGRLECTPFPRGTPTHALELGEPVASAILVQEYLIGLVFLRVCGWMFIVFGVLIVIGSAAGFLRVLLGKDDAFAGDALIGALVAFAMGIGVAGAGAWFGILRGRVVNERCWFCPHGMVWMTERMFDSYVWEDIPEVYARLDADRPAVGIRFDGPISWISFSDSRPSRDVVRYVENRASAAWLAEALRLLAEGKSIRFGSWRLHRQSLESKEASLVWTKVIDLKAHGGELQLFGADGRAALSIWLDDTPLPSLFTALVRALVAHAREQKA